MDQISLQSVFLLVKEFGIPGLVIMLWYFSMKSQNRLLDAYRDDTNKILVDYKADAETKSRMYDNNILLVQNYQSLCGDLKDIVMLNSRGYQALNDAISCKCAALRDR